jgi:hypothetical protein
VIKLGMLIGLRLIVSAMLVVLGVRAIERGGIGFLTLGGVLMLVALVTLALCGLAAAALLDELRDRRLGGHS